MLDKLLFKKSFDFVWNNKFHQTSILVELPVLNKSKCQISGDWGPSYTFELDPLSKILITYTDFKSNSSETFSLDERFLILESPILAELRSLYPLYYIIDHKDKGIRYKIYINKEALLGRIDILSIGDNNCLFTTEVSKACY